MYLCMYVCMYLSIYLSIYLSLYLSISLSLYLSISLPPYLSISLSLYLYLSIYLSLYLSLSLSISLSLCLSACLPVQFFISHLARWLRTRRLCEPTSRPSGATNHWKNTVFCDFPTFSRICIFFLLTLSLLSSSLFYSSLLSDSSHLCFSSVHIVGSLTPKHPSIIVYYIFCIYYTVYNYGNINMVYILYTVYIYIYVYIYY